MGRMNKKDYTRLRLIDRFDWLTEQGYLTYWQYTVVIYTIVRYSGDTGKLFYI